MRSAHPHAQSSPPFKMVDDWLITGAVDTDALVACVDAIIDRHWILRTAFAEHRGRVVQTVLPPPADVPRVEVHVVSADDAAVDDVVRGLYSRPLDIERGDVFRAAVLVLPERRHRLVMSWDHLVCDGASSAIIRRDVRAFYDAFVNGAPRSAAALPPLQHQYIDWSEQQWQLIDGDCGRAARAFWSSKLDGAAELVLSYDRAADPDVGPAAIERGSLDPDLLALGAELAAQEQTPAPLVWLGVLFVLLHRMTGQRDLCIATPVSGRSRRADSSMVGHCTIPLILRVSVPAGTTFRGLCRSVASAAMEADDWRRVPLYAVYPAAPGLWRVAFNHQRWAPTPGSGGICFEPNPSRPDEDWFNDLDLQFGTFDAGTSCRTQLLGRADRFRRETLSDLLRLFAELGREMLGSPDRVVR